MLATRILFYIVTRSRWIYICPISIVCGCVSVSRARGALRWWWTWWQWGLRLGIHLIGLRIDRLHCFWWIGLVVESTERICHRCRCGRWWKVELMFSWSISSCCWTCRLARTVRSIRSRVFRSRPFVISPIAIATLCTVGVAAFESRWRATVAGLNGTSTARSFCTKATCSTIPVRSSITWTVARAATIHAASTSSIKPLKYSKRTWIKSISWARTLYLHDSCHHRQRISFGTSRTISHSHLDWNLSVVGWVLALVWRSHAWRSCKPYPWLLNERYDRYDGRSLPFAKDNRDWSQCEHLPHLNEERTEWEICSKSQRKFIIGEKISDFESGQREEKLGGLWSWRHEND